MSKMAAFYLHLLVLVSVPTLYQHRAEAVSSVEVNRVLLAYNSEYDVCKEITPDSGHESKSAADEACDQAFRALDDMEFNICRGWRHAACRFIEGDESYQCTCIIPNCDDYSIRKNVIRVFRDCAPGVWTEELATQLMAAPSANFQRCRSNYDNALQEALLRRAYSYSSRFGESGSSRGIYNSGGVGSSRIVPTSGGEGTSSGIYVSGYGDAGLAYPSYTPGASSRKRRYPDGGRAVQQPRPHACDECNIRLRSARALFHHKRAHHTVSDHHCYSCNFTYCGRRSFLRHLEKKHPEIVAEEKASQSISLDPTQADLLMPHACPICFKRYAAESSLRDHMKSHTTDETKCRVCKKTLSTKANLKTHLRTAHSDVLVSESAAPSLRPTIRDSESGPFVCGTCGKAYSHKNGLRDHRKSHESMDTYCIFCELYLASTSSYKHHMRRAHPEIAQAESEAAIAQREIDNPEKCEQCNKRFKNDRGLQDHLPYHEGKTSCDDCGKVLLSKSSLATHRRKEHPK